MIEGYNAADEKQVEKRQKKDKFRRQRIDAGFKRLMADADGRAWIWSFLSDCGIFRTSFDPSNARTAFNEGWRAAGLKVTADIHRLCPEQYLRMVNENQTNEEKENG